VALVDPAHFALASRTALTFDRRALELLGRTAEGPTGDWVRAFDAFLAGDAARAATEAEAVEREAARARDPVMVIEAAALRAAATAAAGDLETATALARRASRMARTEAIPEQEYAAHLVLSRIRRLNGHPHLATRILTSIARVAPQRYQAWLAWELLAAGAFDAARESLARAASDPAGRAARALSEVLFAAEAGDRAAFIAAVDALTEAVPWPVFRDEATAILDATDGTRAPRDPDVAAWCFGTTSDSPPALHGVLTRPGSAPAAESAIAYVLAHPGGGRRRLPRLGFGLVDLRGASVLPQGRRKQGRNETLIAALALAGPEGLDEAEAFGEVYDFAYEPEMHRGVFGVCVHRAREYLGDAGIIAHGHGRLTLVLHAPLIVPDPRCVKPMQDRLLRAIASRGGATAQDVAKAVGVSLRVAQQALADLSADGSCLATKEGRKVRYAVEDTTFSEPTIHD
jgi:hypothetical protein